MKRISTDAEFLDSGKLVIDADGIPLSTMPLIIDKSIGTRVFSGEVMLYGDTGWRNISSDLPADVTGTILIRRINNDVHMAFYNVSTTRQGHRNIAALPLGFRAPSLTGVNWRNGLVATDDGKTTAQLSAFGGFMRILNMPAGVAFGGYTVFAVSDSWAASLPGVTV